MKYLNLLVFAALVAASSYLFDEYFVAEKSASQKLTFEKMVGEDLGRLRADKLLPAELGDLREVFISDHRVSKAAVDWQGIAKKHFPRAKKPESARFNLQIEAFDDTKDPLTVLQLSLFEVGNHNKVWELSRTYKSPAEPVSQ